MAVDYFIQWIEAKLVAMIATERARKFYWKKLICHFGLPSMMMLSIDSPRYWPSCSRQGLSRGALDREKFGLVS
ncbi:hypothetical protein CR513_12518, partial [Mucuna pruriens]